MANAIAEAKRQLEREAGSEPERAFLTQLRQASCPLPEREVRFDPKRRWRFDFCWPDRKLAVEVEGAVWSGGRHTRGAGFLRDAEKYNRATELGWAVYRFASEQVYDGSAITVISRILGGKA